MVYTTYYDGEIEFSIPLTHEQLNYIKSFSYVRHMKRDTKKLMETFNPKLTAPGRNDYGVEGEFYVGDDNVGVLNVNCPPSTQPGLWCQWACEENTLAWDKAEGFQNYVEWLEYLIVNFFAPWGVLCNGTIVWDGEETEDMGKIIITDNVVEVKKVTINYE